MIEVGETAIRVRTISEADIRAFATMCEDFNPLHHDHDYARATRFGGMIACGPHYLSLLMGVMASHYTGHGPQVGIEFQITFARPVRPGDTIELKWVVKSIEPGKRGDIVTLDGTITNQHGATVLTSVGKLMALKD